MRNAANSVSWSSLYLNPPPPKKKEKGRVFFLIPASQLWAFLQILTPFLLRRVKADVALNIPPKKELLVYAPMSPVQLELYRATVEQNYNRLLRKTETVKQSRYSYFSSVTSHSFSLSSMW
jgi:SNF2 family DNA or RNA helicase